MNEYIERSKVVEAIEKACNPKGCTHITPQDVYVTALTAVECLTNADVKEVVHGEWLKQFVPCGDCASIMRVCSVCDEPNGQRTPHFCPNCGADMRGAIRNE